MGRLDAMSRTLETPELTERSRADASRAAARAGVEIVHLHDIDALGAASALFADVWGTGNGEAHIPRDLLRALTHAGNYAAGAYADGRLVGAVAGFLGRDARGTYLHSHILGVSAEHRGGNVGFALKQHQRAWALGCGMDRITWTFDPLVRRNAHFNLHKLGAEATSYHESFYGPMTDVVNVGDESDRLLVTWHLDGAAAIDAASDRLPTLDAEALISAGAAVTLATAQDGEPVIVEGRGEIVLCASPEDIVALRRDRPERAHRWRQALRDTLGAAMRDGFVVRGFTRSGWYVLSDDDSSAVA